MTSAFGTLKTILETLAEEPDLVFPPPRPEGPAPNPPGSGPRMRRQCQAPAMFPDLDSGFYEQEDRLNSTLSGLNEAVNAMNRTARRSGDSITGSLRPQRRPRCFSGR